MAHKKQEGHGEGMHRHKEYQGLKNPVFPTPRNIYEGYKLYLENCAECHGENGKGDGSAGESLDPRPSDFTDREWKHGATPGEIFNVVKNGVPDTGMTEWKGELKDQEIWKLVLVVKGFSPSCWKDCPMRHGEKKGYSKECRKKGKHPCEHERKECLQKKQERHEH